MYILVTMCLLFFYSNSWSNNKDIFSKNTINNNYHDSSAYSYFDEYKIGDEEKLYYTFLFKDNYLILLVKMDASAGILEPSTNYIIMEKNGIKIEPFYISTEIKYKITENIKTGILFYELEDMITPKDWKNEKYILTVKNKNEKTKKVIINLELLNSRFKSYKYIYSDSDDKYKKQYLEAKLILAIKEIEKTNTINNATIDSLKKIEKEINDFSDLNNSYLYYYLRSFIEEDIRFSISYFDSSFSKGNIKTEFMNNYFNKSIEYADSLFINKIFGELKNRSDTSLVRFKDLLSTMEFKKNKFKFYNTYSKYYLMETDQEIIENSEALKKDFTELIKKLEDDKNKELECYSRLALGNIYYVNGDNNKAILEYIKLYEDVHTPDNIREKASNNLKKAKQE